MEEQTLELGCGDVKVRGLKLKESRELSLELAKVKKTHSDNEVEFNRQASLININAVKKCVISPTDLNLDEISLADFKKISDMVVRLSGGGDVEKKS